jgi:hypothetical protein
VCRQASTATGRSAPATMTGRPRRESTSALDYKRWRLLLTPTTSAIAVSAKPELVSLCVTGIVFAGVSGLYCL